MTTIRPFSIFDMLEYNSINLDILTETYEVNFYGTYIARWSDCCITVVNCIGTIQAYCILAIYRLTIAVLGKIEGDKGNDKAKNWHGHVSAVTVAPEARRQGIAKFLMFYLEDLTEKYQGYFVDLFVRPSNTIAISMYKSLGYDIYRTIDRYYSERLTKGEDAYGNQRKL